MSVPLSEVRKIVWEELEAYDAPPAPHVNRLSPVESFERMLRENCPGFWEQVGSDEFYIMTGEAQGVTVKVMRRGR